MRQIIWNKLARTDYYRNIDYLLIHWSEKETQAFIDEVFDVLSILEKGNVEFQKTSRKNIRRCGVNKQITLFYRVIGKDKIELIRFWNNSMLQNNKDI